MTTRCLNHQIALGFAFAWALAIALSVFSALLSSGWRLAPPMIPVVLLFFLAALPAGYLGWQSATLYARNTRNAHGGQKFSALVVALIFWSGLLTALLFALQYRQYYAAAHFPAFTIGWIFQFVFTGVAAFYLFAVQGMRLFLPFGVIALFSAGIVFARWSR